MKKIVFYIALIFAIGGCSMTMVSVDSNPPGALVRAKPLSGGEFREIGKTPLVLENKEVVSKMQGSGPVIIEITKEGYKTENIFVTELNAVELKIVRSLKLKEGVHDPRELNAMISEFFDIQRLVRITNYDDALKKLSELEKLHPQLAVIHELRGGIYMVQEKYPEALDAYALAVKLDPSNVESIRVRDILASTLGLEIPKSEAPRIPASQLPQKEAGQ